MRTPDDLTIDDLTIRAGLSDTLRQSREARGIGRRRLGEILGVTSANVYALEHRTTWEARTIMRYARAIGLRIEWVLHNLVVPDDDDIMAVIIQAGDTSTPERADRVHWRAVCCDLVRIRRATTTAVEFAHRIGIHDNALHHWEANPDGSSVITAQRHARALGGHLGWALHEAPPPS